MPKATITKGYLQVPGGDDPPVLLYAWVTGEGTIVQVVRVVATGRDRVAEAVRSAATGAQPGVYRAKVVFEAQETSVTRGLHVAPGDEVAHLTASAKGTAGKKPTAQDIRNARVSRALADGLRAHVFGGKKATP